jgi:hypothetical protein
LTREACFAGYLALGHAGTFDASYDRCELFRIRQSSSLSIYPCCANYKPVLDRNKIIKFAFTIEQI